MPAIWTLEEARAADAWAEEQGVPSSVLLALAGFQLARFIRAQHPTGPIVVLAGPGANGGDGWVAARHLAEDRRVTVVPLQEPRFRGAADWVRAAQSWGVTVASGDEAARCLEEAALVVDAMFGTGFRGSARQGLAGAWLQRLSDAGVPVVAADLPTGVDTDTGAYDGPPLNLHAVVAMGQAKWGVVGYPGAGLATQLAIADIGLPARPFGLVAGAFTDRQWARSRLPQRERLGNKYSHGRVVVIGGSRAMPGAPILAASAALKAGAGLVEMVVPESAGQWGPSFSPALIRHLVPESDQGALVWSDALKSAALGADALVLGPGWGRNADPRIIHELTRFNKPAVVDADAIRLLPHGFRVPDGWALTPHAGELGAFLREPRSAIDADRRGAVLRAVDRLASSAVLLKGRFTLIGERGRIWANPTGSPALATAGSGDVLSGLVAFLLASRLSPFEALALAAYWHGWMGELAGDALGSACTADDLLRYIGPACRIIQEERMPTGFLPWA